MGFLKGRVSFVRFKVDNSPTMFGIEHIEALAKHSIDRPNELVLSGVPAAGLVAGDHVLDTRFDLEKNIVNDALIFGLRVDENKIPSDLLKAHYLVEANALGASNPSGLPSAKQKREAKKIAKEKLEQESKQGKFVRRKVVDLMWDLTSSELLVASTSDAMIDRVHGMMKNAFGVGLTRIDAHTLANENGTIGDILPTKFTKSSSKDIGWATADDLGWLGNEFLVWLWWLQETKDVENVMLGGTLHLECPMGDFGKDSFSGEGAPKLPEAKRALQAGRLPRRAKLSLIDEDQVYTLGINAEGMAIGGAKLPEHQEEGERARLEERITQIRELVSSLDKLYSSFLEVRLTNEWQNTSQDVKEWLK